MARQDLPKKYIHALLCFSALSTASLSAVVGVTTTADSGAGSLRKAITDINEGGGSDSIRFDVDGTITLTKSLPPLGPNVSAIDVNGKTITINGSSSYQAFFANTGSALTIDNPSGTGGLTLLNTASVGGAGGSNATGGGGGALGAGGGLFVGSGSTVTIQGISFSGCKAQGGTGGTNALANGGGGGGGGMNGGDGGNSSSSLGGGGGGGGGGYASSGGSSQAGGGGGGGLFFNGGDGSGGGGGGGSDAHHGSSSVSGTGGDGGADAAGNPGGTGGASGTTGTNGGAGSGNSGGGGGGSGTTGVGGNGGDSHLGSGGGGSSLGDAGGSGGSSATFDYGGGGGGGTGQVGGSPLGGVGGAAGNFGGGGGGGPDASGATGGFGGGGGGSGVLLANMPAGGNGGFGGGGGGGGLNGTGTGGTGGFGAGNGGDSGGGGGGAGLGGAIFLQSSATLTIEDPISLSGSSAAGGTTSFSGGGTSGQAFGTDIFMMATSTLQFNFSDAATTLAINSAIESETSTGGGAGGISMIGAGKVQLFGANTYAGTTTVTSGTLQINGDSSLGLSANPVVFGSGTLQISGLLFTNRAITINTAATLQVDNGTSGTISSGMTGAGTLTTAGPGALFLSGANNYTGTTTAQSGTLFIASSGSISSPAAMTIEAATVVVDGSVTSPITVNAAGTLKGTGTVGNVTLNGTIAPGNSIGTLNVGDISFNPGSIYALEFNNTTSDLIASSGTATINGGTVQLTPSGFVASQVGSYTIITATTVNVAQPFSLINPLTRYSVSLQYDPTDVLLLIQGVIPFSDIVTNGNAGAVARCFDVLANENLPDIDPVIQVLDLLAPNQMAHAFNQMQPANFNNIAFSEENVAERIRQIYTRHFYEQRTVSCPEKEPWRIWAAPFVEKVRQHGTSSLPGYSEKFSGITAAADYRFEKHWMVTGGFSYAAADMHVLHDSARAKFKSYATTIGSSWTDHSWFADALFSYLYSPVRAQRKIDFGVSNFALSDEVVRTAKHHEHVNQVLAHLGGGYNYKISKSIHDTFYLYPFANLDYYYLPAKSYREHGAQSLDLKVYAKRYDLLRPEAGLGFCYNRCFNELEFLFDASLSYVREFRFLGKKTRARFEPSSCIFTVTGLEPENNLITSAARLRLASLLNGFSLTLGYHGEYGAHFHLNAGEAELRKSF